MAFRVTLWALLALMAAPSDWKVAVPDYAWSFPRDHWAHEGYRTEWWYFTGNVRTDDGRERAFGYQLTFFRVGVVRDEPELDSEWASGYFIMGHAALTDVANGRHLFSELLYREMPLLASFDPFSGTATRIGWSRAPAGTDDVWHVDWNGEGFDFHARDDSRGFRFDFSTRPVKPLVFQGPNGFSRKSGNGQASHYYSFTRLATRGEIQLDEARFAVTGESWMDKEFSSSQLSEAQVGWDWFSLQLDDGRELMLYLMRTADGGVDYANGTLVAPDGRARYLTRDAFDVEVLASWQSPLSGARYPSHWRLRVEDEVLEVLPLVDDQENRSRFPGGVFYWEGAVSVRDRDGAPAGRGFVELTGYGEGNRPPV